MILEIHKLRLEYLVCQEVHLAIQYLKDIYSKNEKLFSLLCTINTELGSSSFDSKTSQCVLKDSLYC